MTTTQLTETQLEEVDNVLLTGGALSQETASSISLRYGIDASDYIAAYEQIAERRSHPSVGASGRRALDALAQYLRISAGS